MKKKEKKIAVIGGDVRQFYIAKQLSECGYGVKIFGINIEKEYENENLTRSQTLSESVSGVSLMILPIPFSRDNVSLNAPLSGEAIALEDIYDLAKNVPYVAVGMPGEKANEIFSKSSLVIDYSKSEEFTLKNAYATVEGALAIAIREMPTTLRGSLCAVCGYGRIGKALTRSLVALGCRVKVFARKRLDRISAELEGALAYDVTELSENVSDADLVINTVPSVIIDKNVLALISEKAVLIELASPPGGFDRHVAATLGIRIVNAQSLPGKYSPYTAAKAITESIFYALGEKGVSI